MIDFNPFDEHKWLMDHCPTYITPSFPMMGIVALLLDKKQLSVKKINHIDELQLLRFIPVNKKFSLSTKWFPLKENHYKVQINLVGDKQELIGTAILSDLDKLEQETEPLTLKSKEIDPYEQGLFHERLFQWTSWVCWGENESQSLIEVKANNPTIFLDNLLHGIPHDNLHMWCDHISQNKVAFPSKIENMHFYQPMPTQGEVKVHAQFMGFYKELDNFPAFQIKAFVNHQLIISFVLIETLFPKTNLGESPEGRKEFLQLRHYVADYGLSKVNNGMTILGMDQVKQALWFEGAVPQLYGIRGDLKELTRKIAIQEHIARQLKLHPSEIEVLGWKIARKRNDPASLYLLEVKEQDQEFVVSGLIKRKE